jgi:small subunit ribosomal protein S15
MATLHGRARGKARSHKPRDLKPKWLKLNAREVEQITIQLAKRGIGEAKIGLILRDSYGIPSVKAIVGKKIRQIIKENIPGAKEKVPYELNNLIKRLKKLKKHAESNKGDMTAKRGVQLTESKIRRLEKYYKKKGILAKTWKHTQIKV